MPTAIPDLIPQWPHLTMTARTEALYSALSAVAENVKILTAAVEALNTSLAEVESQQGGESHGEA